MNYWGYAPVSFFAPHDAYSSRQDPLGPLDEFRDMVKAVHRAGIEVILDVVFNHTTLTMLSVGMPILLMGDEVRRTQSGNNNAYCQDSEISWFDWTLLTKHADVHRFVTLLNAKPVAADVYRTESRSVVLLFTEI